MQREFALPHPHRDKRLFPQVLTVISLPAAEDELSRLVEAHLDAIDWVTCEAEMVIARRSNPRFAPHWRDGATPMS